MSEFIFPRCPLIPQLYRLEEFKNDPHFSSRASALQQQDAPEMTLKPSEVNVFNPSHCRGEAFLVRAPTLSRGRGSGKKDTDGNLYLPLQTPRQPEKAWFKGAKQNTHRRDRVVGLIPQRQIPLACKTRSDNCNQFSTFTVVEIITSAVLPCFPETSFSADYFKLI